MEDNILYQPNFFENLSIFGIFDGHGGSEVSSYAANNFVKYLLKNE